MPMNPVEAAYHEWKQSSGLEAKLAEHRRQDSSSTVRRNMVRWNKTRQEHLSEKPGQTEAAITTTKAKP